ncbi:hypothetical protein ACLEPN_10960 [Myxococcus sp. 1LA]
MRIHSLAIALAIPAALSCTAIGAEPTYPTPHEVFFRHPDRVQIFLADHPSSWGGDRSTWPKDIAEEDLPHSGSKYVLPREGPELTSEQRKRLAATYLPPSAPNPFPPKKCMFNPDIALRYWRGKTYRDIVVCLGCIKFDFVDADGKLLPNEHSGYLEDYMFLHQLAKGAFPDQDLSHGHFGR